MRVRVLIPMSSVFGRLTVMSGPFKYSGFKGAAYTCKCECGLSIAVRAGNLRAGRTRSCGCLRREMLLKMIYVHGLARDPAHKVKYTSEWRRLNPEKTRRLRHSYKKKYPYKILANVRKRQAKIIQALPMWADLDKIKEVYREAHNMRERGLAVEVDHIYPLNGKTVSGLHVFENLQIINASENRIKSNSYTVRNK